jgi:hypothetical protein
MLLQHIPVQQHRKNSSDSRRRQGEREEVRLSFPIITANLKPDSQLRKRNWKTMKDLLQRPPSLLNGTWAEDSHLPW